MSIEFITKHEAAKILGVSPDTLKVYRREGFLKEGLEFVRWNSRVIRYCKPLIESWAADRGDPTAHQLVIDTYLSCLASNQPRKSGKPAYTKKTLALPDS